MIIYGKLMIDYFNLYSRQLTNNQKKIIKSNMASKFYRTIC